MAVDLLVYLVMKYLYFSCLYFLATSSLLNLFLILLELNDNYLIFSAL